MRGQVCILFTNKTEKEIQGFIDDHQEPDFAKAGTKAAYTVFLPKGNEALATFGHGMEAYFR